MGCRQWEQTQSRGTGVLRVGCRRRLRVPACPGLMWNVKPVSCVSPSLASKERSILGAGAAPYPAPLQQVRCPLVTPDAVCARQPRLSLRKGLHHVSSCSPTQPEPAGAVSQELLHTSYSCRAPQAPSNTGRGVLAASHSPSEAEHRLQTALKDKASTGELGGHCLCQLRRLPLHQQQWKLWCRDVVLSSACLASLVQLPTQCVVFWGLTGSNLQTPTVSSAEG